MSRERGRLTGVIGTVMEDHLHNRFENDMDSKGSVMASDVCVHMPDLCLEAHCAVARAVCQLRPCTWGRSVHPASQAKRFGQGIRHSDVLPAGLTVSLFAQEDVGASARISS